MISLHDFTDEFAGPAATSPHRSPAAALKAVLSRWLAVTVAAREAKAERIVRMYLVQHDPVGHIGQKSNELQAFRP
jgi:hypothetical protein